MRFLNLLLLSSFGLIVNGIAVYNNLKDISNLVWDVLLEYSCSDL